MALPSTPADDEVVAAVLAGDRDRFRILVERYQGRLVRALMGFCGSADDAEEVAQEAFLRAFVALAAFRPELPFYPWLHAIARNAAISRAARARRFPTVPLDEPVGEGEPAGGDRDARLADPADGPEALAEQRDARAAFWCAVRKLPEEFRSVLIMRLVDDMSYVEIVEATGLPIGTVKSRLARARDRLATLLAAELG